MSIRSTGLQGLWKDVKRDRWLYVFLIPAIVYFFIFHYIPMYGLKIAFYDYNVYAPEKSPFVGFQKIVDLFKKDQFLRALKNTVWISILKLLVGFPAPIILALLLNEMLNLQYKRVSQTLLYLPHFVSWVVLGGILMDLLDPTRGFITQIINRITGEEIQVLTDNRYFVPMLVISQLYKEVGWGTILYLAAISGIDPQLYEAASIDGAGRLKMALHITLPALIPTMVVVFTLNLGGVLRAGFDQIFVLYSPLVYETADIIDTYVYRIGIQKSDYSFSTAAGMFQSFVGLVLILVSNKISKKTVGQGLW